MRFAVHWPGCPVASPRSHGVPRRDVPGRVHVRVAGEAAGRAHEPRLALTRVRIHVPARRAPLAREMRLDSLHRPGALSSSRRTSTPQPDRRISRFSPALARTFRPGVAAVPLAVRVMFRIWRSSTRIRSNSRASRVLAFSAQSLRRSVSRARSRAMACFTCARRFEPALGTGEPAFQAPQPLALRSGQARNREQVTRRQGGRHGHAAVEADYLPVTRRGDRLGDDGEGDMPAPGSVHGHPVGLAPGGTARDQRNRTHPAFGTQTSPVFRLRRRTSHCRRAPHDAEPLVASGLAPRWAPGRVLRVVERRPWPARSLAAPAAAPSASLAASHGCSARASVSWRHCSR